MARIQQGFVKLEKLLQVEPFKIVSLWSNGETRLNDFESEAAQWKNSANKALKKLASPKVFKTAFVLNGTLAFSGSTVRVIGIPGDQPVDFDRRKLYHDSQLIGKAVTYVDAVKHQKSRFINRKKPVPVIPSLPSNSQSAIFRIDLGPINKKIGAPVTPLIVIGDELIEIDNL